jgi:hypothetical protein
VDPDKNLEEQLRLAKELIEDPSDLDSAYQLADLVRSLDTWIKMGGSLPRVWEVF